MRIIGIAGLSIVLLGAIQLVDAAEIYKWVDDNGQVHFTETPPPSGGAETIDPKINSYSSVSYQSVATRTNGVKIYTTSWCGYCKKAKAYFRENNIAFTEYDIEKDSFAKLEYDRLGGKGVPVILAGEQRMNGFSVAGFERIYDPK